MIEGQKSFTSAGNMRAASLPAVCSWVLDTWHSISAKMVAQSFKKCGISNLMNGTEGEILWEETEDAPTTPVDEEDEDEEVMQTTKHQKSGRTCLATAMMKNSPALSKQGLCLFQKTA